MKLKFAAALLAGAAFLAGPAVAQSPIEGVWLTPESSELTVVPCGDGYCGIITKVVLPPEIKAQYADEIAELGDAAYPDAFNKNPSLRNRPVLGLQILGVIDRGGKWDGEVYNPKDGETYSASVTMLAPDRLNLKGCMMMVLCKDQVWTRVIPEEVEAAEAE